jgi:hypothetical protein
LFQHVDADEIDRTVSGRPRLASIKVTNKSVKPIALAATNTPEGTQVDYAIRVRRDRRIPMTATAPIETSILPRWPAQQGRREAN